jgi:hypothetical protein
MLNDGLGPIFDSFMRDVFDRLLVATANEANLIMENESKPKKFKEVVKLFLETVPRN